MIYGYLNPVNDFEFCLPCATDIFGDTRTLEKIEFVHPVYCVSCTRDASYPLPRGDYRLFELDNRNCVTITGMTGRELREYASRLGYFAYRTIMDLNAREVWEGRVAKGLT